MASTYSGLKTEISDFYNRNDLTSVVDTFIDLAEAEMQRELKLLEFETTATVTVTAGVGALPTGFVGARALYWSADPNRILTYLTPDKLNSLNASNPSLVSYYTITGDSFKVANDSSGDLIVTYMARFTPLSDSNTTNSILTNHPGAYLSGGLKYAAIWAKDLDAASGYQTLFSGELAQIVRDMKDRKYAGAALQQRPG